MRWHLLRRPAAARAGRGDPQLEARPLHSIVGFCCHIPPRGEVSSTWNLEQANAVRISPLRLLSDVAREKAYSLEQAGSFTPSGLLDGVKKNRLNERRSDGGL
jgi:hypothetical protein